MAFAATYHPKPKTLGKLIKNSQLLLHHDSKVQRFFLPAPIVSYRSAGKIKDYIARSKRYAIERKAYSAVTRGVRYGQGYT